MKTFELRVNEELTNYIERLNFEVEAKGRIIKTMLGDTSYDNLMENKNFLQYQEKYESAHAEYELAKQEIENLIPDNLRKKHKVTWNLNFMDSLLSITFNCNCFDNVENIEDILKGENC